MLHTRKNRLWFAHLLAFLSQVLNAFLSHLLTSWFDGSSMFTKVYIALSLIAKQGDLPMDLVFVIIHRRTKSNLDEKISWSDLHESGSI